MNQFDEVCLRVIFKHGDVKHPYWGDGSSFLVANSNNYFWITASHVLVNTGGCAQSLIMVSDHSQISLPFNEKYTFNKGLIDDEDHKESCQQNN